MRSLLKWWLKYLFFICFFGICINLLYLAVPVYLMVVYDSVLFSFSRETLVTLSLGLVFTLGVMGILVFLRSRLLVKAGAGLEQELIPVVLTRMHESASGAGRQAYTGGLEDLAVLKNAVISSSFFSLIDTPWIVIYLFLLYLIHPLIAAAALSAFAMAGVFYLLVRTVGKSRYIKAGAIHNAGQQFAAETLDNAELVSGMGMLADVVETYKAKYKQSQALDLGAESCRTFVEALFVFISTLAVSGIYGIGAYLFFNDRITAGVMLAAVMITARLFLSLEKNFSGLKQGIVAAGAYKRLKAIAGPAKKETTLDLPRPEGALSVESAVMAVNGRRVLQNITFSLEPGESLGIIGPSGAGKSVLLKMILGIWAPAAGKVRLDGADTAQWDREDLGRHVGYVPQKADLFSGRVDENIAGLKTVDADAVIKAGKKAFAHEMILKLVNGYDTFVGKAGQNLSDGQKKRIACARALYNDPALVVMDRPNSDLDEEGMNCLLQSMKVLKTEQTTLVMVTENPKFLINTDKILFLKDGQTAMSGPAKEVLAKLANRQPVQQES